MPFIIDAHQDIAYNMLTFGRDYRRSAHETRQLEQDTPTIAQTGQTLLGWPDYQAGQVAVIFNTLFNAPRRYQGGDWDTNSFADFNQAYRLTRDQLDLYNRLCDESPHMFRRIFNRRDLQAVLEPWQQTPAVPPQVTHPVGLVTLMEGAEGVGHPDELEEWWQAGVRAIGLVWAGTRLCGGSYEGEGFTREGYAFMEAMAGLGFTLDISHMNELSANQALDTYPGAVMASHANARALLMPSFQRHLSDTVIRKLIERGGVMGVLPFNRFIKPDWKLADGREAVSLAHLIAHIDHVCQLAGSAAHVGIGTDFDGGFGWPAVPLELNTIADLPRLGPLLAERGYSSADVAGILGGNWLRLLERTLPA